MPEVPVCTKCRKAIDTQKEDYVILNKDTAKYDKDWIYAHAECTRKG